MITVVGYWLPDATTAGYGTTTASTLTIPVDLDSSLRLNICCTFTFTILFMLHTLVRCVVVVIYTWPHICSLRCPVTLLYVYILICLLRLIIHLRLQLSRLHYVTTDAFTFDLRAILRWCCYILVDLYFTPLYILVCWFLI